MPHSHGSGGCSGGCDHNAAGQLGEEFGVQYRYLVLWKRGFLLIVVLLNLKWPLISYYQIHMRFKIFSLYQKIDLTNLECLNESEEGSGKRVFRPWQNRLDKGDNDFVSSDCDAELLFNLPFTGNIKLKVNPNIKSERSCQPWSSGPLKLICNYIYIWCSIYNFQGIIVIGGEDDTHPSKVRLFKNRPHMTFDDASCKGTYLVNYCWLSITEGGPIRQE